MSDIKDTRRSHEKLKTELGLVGVSTASIMHLSRPMPRHFTAMMRIVPTYEDNWQYQDPSPDPN
jgi:hypothetical protein